MATNLPTIAGFGNPFLKETLCVISVIYPPVKTTQSEEIKLLSWEMRVLVSFTLFAIVKILVNIFYRFEVKWIEPSTPTFDKIRLIVFLNHTSLFEPIYLGILPWSFLWRLARKMVAPGADKTLNRPLVGIFWKLFSPNMVSISRKRDKTWSDFMRAIHDRSVIVIAPEGRMKRANGLDLAGNPMTVKSGVSDVLELLDEGNMVIAYSGGLHHVQIPGQHIPRLFKTLKINLEVIDIAEYKSTFNTQGIQWKKDVVADFQMRLENNCPNADGRPQVKFTKVSDKN